MNYQQRSLAPLVGLTTLRRWIDSVEVEEAVRFLHMHLAQESQLRTQRTLRRILLGGSVFCVWRSLLQPLRDLSLHLHFHRRFLRIGYSYVSITRESLVLK